MRLKHSAIVVRDLESGQETEVRTDGLLKSLVVWSADGRAVYFVGAREDDLSRNDIYAATATSAPERLTDAEGFKTAPVVDPAMGDAGPDGLAFDGGRTAMPGTRHR